MDSTLRSILDLARWAPSGDNTQPWRFEVAGPRHVVVHGFDTREQVLYDIDGHPSQIACGALVETMAIAASAHGLEARVRHREGDPEGKVTLDVEFVAADKPPSPLLPFVEARRVQRRALSTRPLAPAEKASLESAVGGSYRIVWREGFAERLRIARLLFASAKIRLSIPEAYEVHRSVIEWHAQFSEDRIPDRAVGLDPLALALMRFAMQSWRRVEFFNRWLAGTVLPRIELDFVPGLACAAHFVLVAERPARTTDDWLDAGRALQRMWLTATSLGLQLQPELTPLVFTMYAEQERRFSSNDRALPAARAIRAGLQAIVGADACSRAVFMGRIGAGRAAVARSLRIALDRLLVREGR